MDEWVVASTTVETRETTGGNRLDGEVRWCAGGRVLRGDRGWVGEGEYIGGAAGEWALE